MYSPELTDNSDVIRDVDGTPVCRALCCMAKPEHGQSKREPSSSPDSLRQKRAVIDKQCPEIARSLQSEVSGHFTSQG